MALCRPISPLAYPSSSRHGYSKKQQQQPVRSQAKISEIERDVHRTYPSHQRFEGKEGTGTLSVALCGFAFLVASCFSDWVFCKHVMRSHSAGAGAKGREELQQVRDHQLSHSSWPSQHLLSSSFGPCTGASECCLSLASLYTAQL